MIKDCTTCAYELTDTPRCGMCSITQPSAWEPKDRSPSDGPPTVLILGHARHGKDTVAEMLRDNHAFSYASSSLFAAERVIMPAFKALGVTYVSVEACFADRVNHRAFWFDEISKYNGGATSRLAKAILKDHQCYVGMRSDLEYQSSLHLFDHVVFVSAFGRGLPAEPVSSFNIAYDPTTMSLIPNNGSLDDLADEVANWVKEVYNG
jgi:hypothetical protein